MYAKLMEYAAGMNMLSCRQKVNEEISPMSYLCSLVKHTHKVLDRFEERDGGIPPMLS